MRMEACSWACCMDDTLVPADWDEDYLLTTFIAQCLVSRPNAERRRADSKMNKFPLKSVVIYFP